MSHRIVADPFGPLYLAGATSWLASRFVVWAQSVPADPASMTDVVGSGGVAVSAGAVALSFISLVRFLAQLYADKAEADRKERDRLRAAEEADKERAAREAIAAREHDRRLRAIEAESVAAKARADAAEAHSRAVAADLMEARERRHKDANRVGVTLLNVMTQMCDNTDAINRMLPAIHRAMDQLGLDVPVPAPVDPVVAALPAPIFLHIEPTPNELGQPPGDLP